MLRGPFPQQVPLFSSLSALHALADTAEIQRRTEMPVASSCIHPSSAFGAGLHLLRGYRANTLKPRPTLAGGRRARNICFIIFCYSTHTLMPSAQKRPFQPRRVNAEANGCIPRPNESA